MPLAKGGGVIAVFSKDASRSRCGLWNGANVAVPIRRHLGYYSVANMVVVSPGEQSSASGRAERRRMEPVVGNPGIGDA